MEREIEQYVKDNLESYIKDFSRNKPGPLYPELTLEEKVLVYYYTEDGYESINEALRDSNGRTPNTPGRYLQFVLNKLPSHNGLVYRGVKLSSYKINVYEEAYKKETIIQEPAFLSTSRSSNIANAFGTTLFDIISKNGKSIEGLSKYTLNNNEQEVLFNCNSRFTVIGFSKNSNFTSIQLEEV